MISNGSFQPQVFCGKFWNPTYTEEEGLYCRIVLHLSSTLRQRVNATWLENIGLFISAHFAESA